MNRLEIIREISKHLTTEKDAKTAVLKTFELMAGALRSNEKVVISNFGTFRVKERLPRPARNPRTNQRVMVGPRKSIRFKPSKKLTSGI
ncbi:MAG: HU family DNA-binding protein [Elusimicrobia bacterium]|nr:HU family DNA-binding protein [Elusimicrobiota bacterium]